MNLNLMDCLSEGKENSIKVKELCKILGWNSREITLAINALRRSGEVICSCERGYYLPSCLEDAQDFYARIKQN